LKLSATPPSNQLHRDDHMAGPDCVIQDHEH
jgi:hypothetical protein